MKDYFKLLGVSYGASDDEIKKASKKLFKKYHPDYGGDKDFFHDVKIASETLLDHEKKKGYLRGIKTAKTKCPLTTLDEIWSGILGE